MANGLALSPGESSANGLIPVATGAREEMPTWIRDCGWATRARWEAEQGDRLEDLAYDDEQEDSDALPF